LDPLPGAPEEAGTLIYVKPGVHSSEPPDIRAYAALHEQFPHESTADQWFSESQMESYRGLGSHIIGKLCGSLETARTAPGGRLDIEALAHSVTCYLESTRAQPPVVSDAADPRLTGVPAPAKARTRRPKPASYNGVASRVGTARPSRSGFVRLAASDPAAWQPDQGRDCPGCGADFWFVPTLFAGGKRFEPLVPAT